MRYELDDYEWGVIQPMLPNKPRGVPRVDDRRVLKGIFWVLRSGAQARDFVRRSFGPIRESHQRRRYGDAADALSASEGVEFKQANDAAFCSVLYPPHYLPPHLSLASRRTK